MDVNFLSLVDGRTKLKNLQTIRWVPLPRYTSELRSYVPPYHEDTRPKRAASLTRRKPTLRLAFIIFAQQNANTRLFSVSFQKNYCPFLLRFS